MERRRFQCFHQEFMEDLVDSVYEELGGYEIDYEQDIYNVYVV